MVTMETVNLHHFQGKSFSGDFQKWKEEVILL